MYHFPEVRRWLSSAQVQESSSRAPPRSTFAVQKLNAPSAGLRCKVFAMKPEFLLPKEGLRRAVLPLRSDQKAPSTAAHSYTIRSIPGSRMKQFYIGLLPGRAGAARIGSIVCAQDHEIWTKTDPIELRAYLEERMPQVDVNDLITEQVRHLTVKLAYCVALLGLH
jgi:hypothetical protein